MRKILEELEVRQSLELEGGYRVRRTSSSFWVITHKGKHVGTALSVAYTLDILRNFGFEVD